MALGPHFWEGSAHPRQPDAHLPQPGCTTMPQGSFIPPSCHHSQQDLAFTTTKSSQLTQGAARDTKLAS